MRPFEKSPFSNRKFFNLNFSRGFPGLQISVNILKIKMSDEQVAITGDEDMKLSELIPLINDEAEEIVLMALTTLSSIVKKDKELTMAANMEGGGGEGPLIVERRVVEELLRTLKKHKKNKKVACYALKALHFIADNEPSGRELFVQTVNANGTGCLEELVHCIGTPEHSCFKYAFLVLHNLMSDGRIGPKVIAFMCEMRILTKVLGWLTDKNEKFLSIVTDTIDKLISSNSEQMAFFIGLNGHQKLINVLIMAPPDQQMPSSAVADAAAALQQQQQPQAFTLLNRVAKLLYKITIMYPVKMISAGLLETAQKHLLGGQINPRFLRQLLNCIRAASHVPSTGHQIQPLLHKLLELLGTNDDIRLKELCTDILANLTANNAQNKEFLVEDGAIYCLFHLLNEMDGYNNNDESQGPARCHQMDDDIEERAMALLKSLCKGNDRSEMAKMQVMGTEKHKRLLLASLRQRRNLALLRRTLMMAEAFAKTFTNDTVNAQLKASEHCASSREMMTMFAELEINVKPFVCPSGYHYGQKCKSSRQATLCRKCCNCCKE